MKLKLFAVLFLIIALLASGCVDDGETEVIEENTSEDMQMNETPMEDNDTSMDENETPMEEDDDKLVITPPEGARTYTIRLENFLIQPGNLTINKGDTVVWINFNDPKRIAMLVSNEGAWENTSIGYRNQYSHTFNETGTYTYKALGLSFKEATIIVK
ncbi:hypothetical protein V7O66_03205 [Methanolobus sp. ZRKC3]|uniref:hypothetical protein n=1 Tax=Methanolobus sp. ZRKC3 TaxID=3125786 RepID=UPI00324FFE81